MVECCCTLQRGSPVLADKLGGFGGAPKFPRPVNLNFLMSQYSRMKRHYDSTQNATTAMVFHMVSFTLDCMAKGTSFARCGMESC